MGELRKNLEDLNMNGVIGDWCFLDTKQGLTLALRYPVPKGDWMNEHWPDLQTKGDIVFLPLSGEGRQVWQWDGNREAPTLSPSILIKGREERWHGWFRSGKLETA